MPQKLMSINGVVRVVLIPDDKGRITIPKDVLKKYKGCGFTLEEHEGKLVLNPIKLELCAED